MTIDLGTTLALAVVAASDAPVLLLDEHMVIVAASRSFCSAFALEMDKVVGKPLADIDHHHWDIPRLRSLISATLAGIADVDSYEMDVRSSSGEARRVVLKTQRLDYGLSASKRLLMTVIDVTEIRRNEALQKALVHDHAVLLHEMQHRVANSLQIIASILMQSVRKVQSVEARGHLSDAHQRVMSIATLQRQLAESGDSDVMLAPYLSHLCASIAASMIQDHDRLSINTQVADGAISSEQSISIGLVVTELVINALKHAFPDEQRGIIRVDYAVTGINGWTLTVSDDGVGMPNAPDMAKAGLGTSIVQALAKQLNAQINVSDAEPGTRVTLTHMGVLPGQPVVVEPAV